MESSPTGMSLEAQSRLTQAAKPSYTEPTLRPAFMSDVEGIYALIEEASRTSTVLPRSRDSICENLRDYLVAEIEGRIVGCGALHIWGVHLAEVRSLVVSASLRGKGLGGRIVQGLLDEARRLHLQRLFVLTDNVTFFCRQGFAEVDRGTLPHKVWNECILCPKFEDCGEISLDMKI
jgi:amino-acid N-acetyltransferase